MVDLNKLRRELDILNSDLSDVNRILLETEEASDGLVKKMKDLSGIGTRGGILRSIFTRFSVAVPSLYKLTQQASSLLLIFRYIDTSRTESLKEEAKVVESLKRREEVQRRLFKLSKATSTSGITALEKEKYYNDTSIKNMMKTMPLMDAIKKTQEKVAIAKEKIAKADDKIFKRARQQFVRENYGTMGLTGGNLLGKAAVVMNDRQYTETMERRKALVAERNVLRYDERDAKGKLNRATSEAGRRRYRAELDIIESALRQYQDSIANANEELEIIREERRTLIAGSEGKGFKVGGTIGRRSFTDLTPYEKRMLYYQKIQSYISDRYGKVYDGIKNFFSKGNLKVMAQNAAKFGKLFYYGLLAVTGVAILIYFLKRMNFFEKAGEAFEYMKPLLTFFTQGFMKSVAFFLEGASLFMSGIGSIITGVLSGNNTKIWTGLRDIFIGAIQGLLGAGGIILTGLFAVGVGLFNLAVATLWGTVVGYFEMVIDGLRNLKDNTREAVRGTVSGMAIGSVAGAVLGGIVGTYVMPGVGTAAGVKYGAAVGASIGGFSGMRDGMASGGTNLIGGNYLVGENGPEIVSIPGGSSVINNTNTRSAMGNTIHVHVNGRVGASEQELNQLADKIGQKISMRMNRFSPTGMRG